MQISTALPVQRYAPGVHDTEETHAPAVQPKLHAVVGSHVPEVHVSTLPVEVQRFAPVVHVVQTPAPVHDWPAAHATGVDQPVQPVVFISQVSTVSPAPQRFVPAVHASVQVSTHASPEQVFGLGHAEGSDQSLQPDDLSSQVWTLVPEHFVAPTVVHASVHVGEHTPPLHALPLGQGSAAERAGQPLIRTHSRTWVPSHTFVPTVHVAAHVSPLPPSAVSALPASTPSVSAAPVSPLPVSTGPVSGLTAVSLEESDAVSPGAPVSVSTAPSPPTSSDVPVSSPGVVPPPSVPEEHPTANTPSTNNEETR